MRMKKIVILVMVIFLQSIYYIAIAQTDPFDRVEKVLRQHGKGVYRDGAFLSKDIIKGKYAYIFAIVEKPVRREGKIYVPDTERPTPVTMWKEVYNKKKGPGEGKTIIFVQRNTLGYSGQIAGKSKFTSKKEVFELAEQIIKESGL